MISDCHPISIICNFGEIFEIIRYDGIYKAVQNSISTHQHGFMNNRLTVTNLACISQFILEVLDSSGQVDVTYIDIQEAFDEIDHYLLLSKLHSFGFSSPLLWDHT